MVKLADIRPKTIPAKPFGQLLEGLTKTFIDENISALVINGISLNTADIHENYIFVAVKGLHTHGAEHFEKAVKRGAVAIVTDAEGASVIKKQNSEIPVVIVENPRIAGAEIATRLYDYPADQLNLVGITGTNGKTTTAFMLRAMLADAREKVLFSGTVETQIGDLKALSTCTTVEAEEMQRLLAVAVEKQVEGGVLEVSSHALIQERIRGTKFKIAVFMNLTPEHLDYHKTIEGYYQAKKILFTPQYSESAVICIDDQWGERLATEIEIPAQTVRVFSTENTSDDGDLRKDDSSVKKADWQVVGIKNDLANLLMVIELEHREGAKYTLRTPIIGRVNAQNAVVAFICALQAGVSPEVAIERLSSLYYIPGRMVIKGGIREGLPLAINDFAHTPEAIEKVFKMAAELTDGKVHVVVAHDGERDAAHRPKIGRIAAQVSGKVWVTDCNPRSEDPAGIRAAIIAGVKEVRPDLQDVIEVNTWRTDAVREALYGADPGDVVVFIAKGAESYQEIRGVKHSYDDTSVIVEVLEAMRRRL